MKRVLGRLLVGAAVLAGCDTPFGSGSVPAAPANVTAFPGADFNAITVTWPLVEGATSYNMYWGTSPGVTPRTGTKLVDVTFGQFVHNGLTAHTTYYYVVTGVNERGEGAASAVAQATTSDDLGLAICQPQVAGAFGGTQLLVAVRVVSRYQLAGVTASVNGRSVDLVFQPLSNACIPRAGLNPQPLWVGTVSLIEAPRGMVALTVSATDVGATTATGSVAFFHDAPPTLTIAAPDDFYVARPGLRVAASCHDDDSKGCASLKVSVDGSEDVVLATGESEIDRTVSLTGFDGQAHLLVFEGRDSSGQVVKQSRLIFVESSSQLNEIASVDGRIFDVEPDRILFLDQSTGGNVLTIRDRASGSDEVIYDQAGHAPSLGFLTPVGAVFLEEPFPTPSARTLHEWRLGALGTLSGNAPYLTASDRYAVFAIFAQLMRRDVVTGVNTSVPGTSEKRGDVAPNGDVVYSDGRIYRFRDGVSTQLTTFDAATSNQDPVTDGINVVYVKHANCCGTNQIAVYYASGEHVLSPGDHAEKVPGRDYQAANGWVAYTKPGTAGELQVWSRSPTGEEVQVTRFGTSSYIDGLGPNGEIALINTVGGTPRRYLVVPDYSMPPRDLSSGLGKAFFQSGNLYVTIGRSLFQVNP